MSDIRERLAALLWEKFGVWPNGPLAAWLTEADCGRFADTILSEFDVTPRREVVERDDSDAHDHEWQRRQNVTSSGYRMTPYEVCVVDGCDAARQVIEKELPDE